MGSHGNYITHIAFPNHFDYLSCKKRNEEQGRSSTSIKYGELRLFLNAVESLNNILDYLHSEHKDRIKKGLREFKKAIKSKFPVLGELSDLANAYKHCGRFDDGQSWKRASDLQKAHLNVQINVTEPTLSCADYQFWGPLLEHDKTLNEVFRFWQNYHNNPTLDELINV